MQPFYNTLAMPIEIIGSGFSFPYILQYLAISLIFLTVGIFAYIKLRYPFWNSQPVYHIYDFWRSFYTTPFIIRRGYPLVSKFCDFDHIKTFDYVDLTGGQIAAFIDLVQCHWAGGGEKKSSENPEYEEETGLLYAFTAGNFDAYMSGHIYPSFVSFYLEPQVRRIKSGSSSTISDEWKVPYACMTSRSIIVQSGDRSYNAYYWDFLTCNRNRKRDPSIMRRLIQTHTYRTMMRMPEIPIAFFRKNGIEYSASTGIVSVVEFPQRLYMTKGMGVTLVAPQLPKYFIVVDVTRTNLSDFFQFLDETAFYAFTAVTNIGNISEMVLRGVIYIYLLTSRGKIFAAYIFRDSRICFEENGGPILELVASICGKDTPLEVFYGGFLHARYMVFTRYPAFYWLSIDGVGSNVDIMRLLEGSMQVKLETICAYYFYNFFCPKIEPSRAFVLL
jgi:hypothetical protein